MRSESLRTEADVRARLGGPRRPQVEMVPGGPALVRGAASVEDAEGTAHEVHRSVVAVCTCGLTQRGPWCDATHKVVRNS